MRLLFSFSLLLILDATSMLLFAFKPCETIFCAEKYGQDDNLHQKARAKLQYCQQ